MAIFKKNVDKNFTVLRNNVINDTRLSWKARGILIYLLSKPDTWRANIKDISNQSEKDGEKAVSTALHELRNNGYLKMFKGKRENEKGEVEFGTFYDVYEEPVE